MAIPGWAAGGLVGGALGAAEGNRQNILKDDPNDPGGQFLNYYIKDRLPAILGGGLGALGGAGLGKVTGMGVGKGGLIGGLAGAGLGHVLSTDAAKEARERGPLGRFPEFGLSEGLGSLIPGLQNVHPAFRPGDERTIAAETAVDQAMNPQAWGAALPQGVRF